MTAQERMLYQQIHPAKLLTDFGSSFASTWLLWHASYATAAFIAFVPSIVVTLWLIRFADLERMRATRFGSYLKQHMPAKMVWSRSVGQLMAWGGAISHLGWLVPLGYFVIVLSWLNGLWDTQLARPSASTSGREGRLLACSYPLAHCPPHRRLCTARATMIGCALCS